MAHMTLDRSGTCYGQCSLAASATNHKLAVPFHQGDCLLGSASQPWLDPGLHRKTLALPCLLQAPGPCQGNHAPSSLSAARGPEGW